MAGFEHVFEDESSNVRVAGSGGVPFEFAVKTAREEVVGTREDMTESGLDEGESEEEMEARCDAQVDLLEKAKPEDYGVASVAYDGVKKQVLDALMASGKSGGFTEMSEMDDLPAMVQQFLEDKPTKKPVTLEDLLEVAEAENHDDFLRAFDREPAASPSAGM